MSILLLKEDFFKELENATNSRNLTLAAGPSRTAVGFTNNFTTIPPVIKNDTEINIYRPLPECKGTPCDVNRKKQTGSQELILCECLPVDNTNGFFKKLKQTGEVADDASSAFWKTVKDGFLLSFIEPEKTFADYRIWINCAGAVFLILSIGLVIGIIVESFNGISPIAIKFFNKWSTQFMKSERVKAQGTASQANQKQKENEEVKEKEDDRPGEKSGIQSDKSKTSETSDKPMSELYLFWIIYLTNHVVLAIFFSKSTHYSRKSLMCSVYSRMAYSLAISMLFGIGYSSDGYGSYENFVLKCLFAPFMTIPILFTIKKLMKDDLKYVFIRKCTKKFRIKPAKSRLSNAAKPKDSSAEQAGGFPRTLTAPNTRGRAETASSQANINEGSETTIISTLSPRGDSSRMEEQEKDKEFKTTYLGGFRILLAYSLNIILVLLSIVIVVSVANTTSKNDKWPKGYWYALQLLYDMTLGQALLALLQYGLFKAYLRPESWLSRFVNKTLACLFFNSDVKEIAYLTRK